MCERISVWNRTSGSETNNAMHVPSKAQNLRTETLITCNCRIYRRLKLIFWPMNTYKNLSLSSNQWTDCLQCGWTPPSHFLQFLPISSFPLNLSGLTCHLPQFARPKLQFLCYSQINSVSGNLCLPQFTFFTQINTCKYLITSGIKIYI